MDFLEQTEKIVFWTPRRRELKSWFERNAPGLGELYVGALNLIYSNQISGRTRFIAHAIREIGNRLPGVITGETTPRFDWLNNLDELAMKWNNAGLFSEELFSNMKEVIKLNQSYKSIPYNLYLYINSVLNEYNSKREKGYDKAERLFKALSSDEGASHIELIPTIKNWYDTIKWFVGKAHDWKNTDSKIEAREFYHHFEVFEHTLTTIISAFYKTMDEIDEILEEANS